MLFTYLPDRIFREFTLEFGNHVRWTVKSFRGDEDAQYFVDRAKRILKSDKRDKAISEDW